MPKIAPTLIVAVWSENEVKNYLYKVPQQVLDERKYQIRKNLEVRIFFKKFVKLKDELFVYIPDKHPLQFDELFLQSENFHYKSCSELSNLPMILPSKVTLMLSVYVLPVPVSKTAFRIHIPS